MKKVVASFEELIQSYYGASSDIELRPLSSVDALVANYYGKPACQPKPNGKLLTQVTMSFDNGEVLADRKNGKCKEYVVQRALSTEYVVERRDSSPATPARTAQNESSQSSAAQECQVDVLQSLQPPAPPSPAITPSVAQTFTASGPVSRPEPAALPSAPAKNDTNASEDDFAADLQAILTGQKVYDPRTKKTTPREQLDRESTQPAANGSSPRPGESPNQHEIFDRIAQNMKYANTFDLGEVELTKRLDEFDTLYGLQQRAKERKATGADAPAASASTGDFIRDLDAIRNHRAEGQPATSLSVAADTAEYSRPLFDTGEHVLIAADLYEDQLRVGKDPGVSFSYGQIVAMADLFESVDQMMLADPSELEKIKALIKRSTEYYKTGKRNRKLDVENEEWNKATGGRFLDLAEDNYEHFSPNFFFPNASFAGSLNQHGNNKSEWERYHKRAIEEAQRAYTTANPNTSVFPDWALIINAFGDHYLTDAFAAGHVINKEEMIAHFKSNFFDGSSLRPEAKKFFKKLAKQVWHGEVAEKFSKLETADLNPRIVCAWGWCLGWHSNIDSSDMFETFLNQAAEQQPEGVANLAVKALHDRLNEDGIEVTNRAGYKHWWINGDGYSNTASRDIIRRAVIQSANQINNDPSILASNLNYDLYFADVWKYVPQPTEKSKQRIVSLANDYLSPSSDRLVTAAAKIITHDLDALIDRVVNKERKLRPA